MKPIVGVLLAAIFSGCSIDDSPSGPANDIRVYLREINALGPEELAILSAYETGVTNPNTRRDDALRTLGDIIPRVQGLIASLVAIHPPEQAKTTHEKVILVWNLYFDAFVLIQTIIADNDATLVAQFNEKLIGARQLAQEARRDLDALLSLLVPVETSS